MYKQIIVTVTWLHYEQNQTTIFPILYKKLVSIIVEMIDNAQSSTQLFIIYKTLDIIIYE